MSKAEMLVSESELRLDDQAIAEYLKENPEFFARNPELIASMKLPHEQQGTVSLIERQQRLLRDQIELLQEEITDLMSNARRNEHIFRGYSALYTRLLRCQSLTEVSAALHDTFINELSLPELTLKFFIDDHRVPDRYRFSADTHKQLLSKRFVDEPVYFGRLTQDELNLLFPGKPVQSVALMLLGRDPKVGLLALGSHDPSHFEPNMDYLLISQLQALLSVVLPGLVTTPE
ncbi:MULTISPECIES: DUF484 family protein [Aliidiomarina]|nr:MULTISPECIES: DUF484 family protein [Aliidiomarina]